MANQFVTGQGQGVSEQDDPLKRTLASGVNAGQAQPNLDPGKVGNPYAGGAAARGPAPAGGMMSNPYAAPNPYGSGAQTQDAGAPQPAKRPAAAPSAPAPTPSDVSQPSGQQMMANYVAGHPGYSGNQSAPAGLPPALPELTTGPTGLLSPAQQQFDQGVAAQGEQLRQAADTGETAQQRGARLIREGDAFNNAQPTGGYGGGSALASTMVAQSAAAASEASRGDNQIKNREAYQQWQQSEKARQEAEYARRQEESDRALKAYEMQLNSYNLSQHDKHVAIQAEKDRQAKNNLAGLTMLGAAFGSVGGPVGSAVGAGIARALGGGAEEPKK